MRDDFQVSNTSQIIWNGILSRYLPTNCMVHQCHETCFFFFFFNWDNILGADLYDGPYVAPNLIVTEHTTFYSIHVPLLLNTWYYREGYVYIPSFLQSTAPTGTLTCWPVQISGECTKPKIFKIRWNSHQQKNSLWAPKF